MAEKATDVLRRAAALMRDRAKCGGPSGFPAPWGILKAEAEFYGGDDYYVTCEDGDGEVTGALNADVATHVASWDPTVALAVAAWLDDYASWLNVFGREGIDRTVENCPALHLAYTYLGENS